MTERALPGRGDARARLRDLASWVPLPLGIGLLSRAFSTLLILWANRQRPDPIPHPFSPWDGLWYLSIAEHGYHKEPIAGPLRDIAFFPLWPGLMRFSRPEFVDLRLWAPLLAAALFVLACVLVWRLFADRFGPKVATTGTALFAFSPAAYVASMAYSEPLFLVLAASAFLLERRYGWRALATALAFGTRIVGSALVLAALFRAWAATGRERLGFLAVAAAGCAAFALWWAFVGTVMGDPMGFLKGSPSWATETGIWGVVEAFKKPDVFNAAWFAVYAVAIAGGVALLRHDLELGLYAVGALALAFLPGGLTSSFPRYAISAFPLFAGLALAVRDRELPLLRVPLGTALVLAAAAFQVLFAYWALDATRAP